MDGFLNTYLVMLTVVRLMVLLLILPLHEFAHAWAADKLGDNTPRINGRLTLSPLAHLDFVGTVLLLFTGFGWAKPVPIQSSRFRNPRKGVMLTALAGPAVNLLAALAGTVVMQILGCYVDLVSMGNGFSIMFILETFVLVNVQLFVFNMLPIPPLDGSKVLIYILPKKAAVWFIRHQTALYYIMLVCMAVGVLFVPINIISTFISWGLSLITSWIPMLLGGL